MRIVNALLLDSRVNAIFFLYATLFSGLPEASATYLTRVHVYDGDSSQVVHRSSNYILNVTTAGNIVAWQESIDNKSQVLMYDGQKVHQLSNNDLGGSGPQIDGSNVFWSSSINGVFERFVFDGESTIQVTQNGQRRPTLELPISTRLSIQDHNIVAYRDGILTEVAQIDPAITISGSDSTRSRMVWSGKRTGENDSEIFLYDGKDILQLTDNSTPDYFPQISDSLVTWIHPTYRNEGDLLYVFDGNESRAIASKVSGVSVGGDRIGYESGYGYFGEFYIYEDGDSLRLTDNNRDDSGRVSKRWVAWKTLDYDLGVLSVHVYDGQSVFEIPSRPRMGGPYVTDSMIVLWETYYVPEPETLSIAFVIASCGAFIRRSHHRCKLHVPSSQTSVLPNNR
jgi:hypothetical protein